MIRVLIIHEHYLMGNIMTAALQDKPGIQVIGYTNELERVLAYLEDRQCDIILASVALSNDAAMRIARIVNRKGYAAKVLITEMIDSKAAILHCIEEGAAGYVYEHESLASLVEKICALHQGEFPLPPPIAAGLIARINELKRQTDAENSHRISNRRNQCEELTAREREVLHLMALGHTNQTISEMLIIEVGTVKNHVHNIFRKLDIQSRDHATFFAQQLA